MAISKRLFCLCGIALHGVASLIPFISFLFIKISLRRAKLQRRQPQSAELQELRSARSTDVLFALLKEFSLQL
jgi:hypothetical protein